jgi:hypothetical protein
MKVSHIFFRLLTLNFIKNDIEFQNIIYSYHSFDYKRI